MKKVWLILALCCMLLGSCGHRTSQQTFSVASSTTSTEDETKTDLLSETLPILGLAGKSEEELLETYANTVYYNEEMMSSGMDTPTVLYISRNDSRIPLAYDKKTGTFSSACRDSLCDHETCLWGICGRCFYLGSKGLYFLYTDEEESVIYSTDFYGNHAEKLYCSSEYDISHLVEDDGFLYALAEGYDEEAEQSYTQIIRINLQNHDKEVVLKQQGLYYFMPLWGELLYFDGEMHRILNIENGTSLPYGDDSFLPIATHGEYFYFSKGNLLYRLDTDGNEILLDEDLKTVSLRFVRNHIWFADTDGNIYRTDLSFETKENVFRVDTDSRIDFAVGDGNFLYCTYNEGNGASRIHYAILCDLHQGTVLKTKG